MVIFQMCLLMNIVGETFSLYFLCVRNTCLCCQGIEHFWILIITAPIVFHYPEIGVLSKIIKKSIIIAVQQIIIQ